MESSAITQASNYFDLQGLDQLRQKAQGNEKDAIREVANQFESMFASLLIKSMRQANEAFETDSPFNNKHTKFYTDMQDKQLALDISRHGSLGLADALVRQLDPASIAGPQSVAQDKLRMPDAQQREMMALHSEMTPREFNKPDRTQASRVTASIAPMKAEPLSTVTPPVVKDALPTFSDPKSFVQAMMPYAQKVAQRLGLSAPALVAQSALETGWGQKIINGSDNQSSFNLFNIKASRGWEGGKVSKNSLEVEEGIGIKRRSDFRAYDDYEHSFQDYARFITSNQRYQEALKQGDDAGRYVEELQRAGYATDPQYAEKIKQIMNSKSFKAAVAEGASNG